MYKKLIFGMMAFALITVLFAACSIKEAATSSGINARMGSSNFIDTKVSLKKGQSVTLVDVVSSLHTITNGSWDGSQAKPAVEPGAPQVHFSISSAGASQNVGPFTTAGTFHLYCTIHPGMNLEIDVQ
jgi:plastocyanin